MFGFKRTNSDSCRWYSLDNNGDIKLGNIFKETLEDILEKEETINIKKNFENGIITCKLCKTCGFLKRLENKRNNKIDYI